MHRSSKTNYSSLSSAPANGDAAVRNRSILEDENERMTERLGSQITALKSLTIDIGSEIRGQNKMLNEMDSDFEASSGFLGSAMTRLKKIQRAGYGSVVWKLLAFVLLFCVIIYLLLKFR